MFSLMNRQRNFFEKEFDKIFKDTSEIMALPLASKGYSSDLKDLGDHYLLTTDMPGIKKEHLEISINTSQETTNLITIKADNKDEDFPRKYMYRYVLPKDISYENTSATIEDGVLQVKFQKRDPPDTSIKIEVT